MPFLAPAIAAIGSAVAGAAAFIGGLGAIGQAVIGIGLSLVSSALKKKEKGSSEPAGPTGTKLDVQYGAALPREIGLGLFAVAGHDIYTNTFGSSNKEISKVFILSDFRIDGVEQVAVNGAYVGLIGPESEKGFAVDGAYLGHLWIKFYRGLPDQAADPYLVATSNPAGRWTAAHRLAGIAYAIVTAEWDDEAMSSFPQLLFEIRGAPLYDVRRDSTAGGSGPHRWENQSTWQYASGVGTNPIIQAYNYERGFHVNGELVLGKGMPATDLPAAAWMSAMNVCDEIIDGAPRYRSGCLVTAADGVSHRDNLEPILQAAAAALVERVDGDQPLVGANQPVVATLTDDDLIVGAPANFQAKRSRSDLVNSVFGSFNSPGDLWSATAYPPKIDASGLAADRERHAVQLDFGAVYDLGQAIRLADIAVRESRYQARATITVRPRWIVLEPGDWIAWNSARRGSRIYRVTGRSLAPLGENGARNVTLSLQEVGAGIYDSTVVIPEVTPRISLAGPVRTLTAEDFVIIAVATTAPNGRKYPALLAQWSAIDDVTVDSVLVEYWKTDDPTRRVTASVRMPATQALLVEGVLPLTRYTAHACVVTNPPRITVWSREWSVTSLTEDLAFDAAQLSAELTQIIVRGREVQADFEERIEALAASTFLTTGQQLVDIGGVSARLIDEAEIRQSETEALATRTTGVEAGLSSALLDIIGQASAVNTLAARVTTTEDGLTATSSAVTEVQGSLSSLTGTVVGQGTALTSLTQTVTTQGDAITTTSEAVTAVQGSVSSLSGTVTGQAAALSSLSQTVTAQDATITASAQALTGVQATVGTLAASGLISFQVVAGGGGASSRIAILAKAGAGDTFKESGIYIDTTPSGSTILIRADKFAITDGATTNIPFVVSGGTVKLNLAYFNQLVSSNGRLAIDGNAGRIVISGD